MNTSAVRNLLVITALCSSISAAAQTNDEMQQMTQFSGALAQHRTRILSQEGQAEADAVNRDLREAYNQARRADSDAVRQAALDKWNAAEARVVKLLATARSVVPVSMSAPKTVMAAPPPFAFESETGAILFRVNPGGAVSTHTYIEFDFSEISRYRYTVNVEGGTETWVLIGFKNIPQLRTIQEFEFVAGDASTVAPVTFTTPDRGTLRMTVLSDDTGKPTPSMVSIRSKLDGRDMKPGGALDFSPQFDKQGNFAGPRRSNLPGRFGGSFWCVPGEFSTALPPGEYSIAIGRGIEHAAVSDTVTIASNSVVAKTYRPERWVNMSKRGWWSGDDHVHCQILSDADAENLMRWVQAEDVHLANVVKMGDIYRTWFEQRGFGRAHRFARGNYVLSPGQECPRTHNELGHTLHMNISRMIRDTDRYYLYDEVFDAVQADGGLSGYAHVNSNLFHVDRDMTMNIPKEKVDFVELLQFAHLGTDVYYDFLNTGFKVTASAGSDVPWGGSVGEVRVYAYLGRKKFTPDRWFAAVEKGNTFVTNGVMLDFRVDKALPGDTITVDEDRMLRVRARAWGDKIRSVPSKLEIVVHGDVVRSTPPSATGSSELALDFELPAGNGFWIAARAEGDDGSRAHTTPVYVVRDGLRFWKYPDIEALISKRLASLSEIEQIIADAQKRDSEGAVDGDRPIKQLAMQGEALLERVREARQRYEGLTAIAESERSRR